MLKRLFRTIRLFCQRPYYFADTGRGLICGRFIREEGKRLVLETDKGGPIPLTSVLKSSLLSCSEVCKLVRTLRVKDEILEGKELEMSSYDALCQRLPVRVVSEVYQAIGRAGACWENLNSACGFDAEQASSIAGDLCNFIADFLEETGPEEAAE